MEKIFRRLRAGRIMKHRVLRWEEYLEAVRLSVNSNKETDNRNYSGENIMENIPVEIDLSQLEQSDLDELKEILKNEMFSINMKLRNIYSVLNFFRITYLTIVTAIPIALIIFALLKAR